jgi:signal peptidase II
MKTPGGKYRYLLLALLIVAVDQWTKWWVEVNLAMHEVRRVLPSLNLTRVTNTGVAFGLLPARGSLWGTLLLTVLGLVALAVVATFFLRARRRERWLLTGLGLILGGAVGNLIDRILSGGVTDFIDFYIGSYHWHTFNVADSSITVGIVFMVIDSFSSHSPEEEEKEQRREPEPPMSTAEKIADTPAADDEA